MGILLKSLKNEVLLLKNYQSIISSPYLSIKNILDSLVKNKISILDNSLFVVGDIVVNKNTISSPVTTIGIINKINDNYSFYDSIGLKNTNKMRFSSSDKQKAMDYSRQLLLTTDKLLITNSNSDKFFINSKTDFEYVWGEIVKSAKYCFVEKVSKGDLFKVFIKDDSLLAVYLVAPAHVIGNGRDSIEKLILDLKILRESNILYRMFNTMSELNEFDYIPKKGEFVKLNNSLDLEHGAVYIDMTHLLQDKFKNLPKILKKNLFKINYLEVSCYSENILSGISDESFIISDIKQNNADLKDLFSCCDDEGIKDLALKLFNGSEGALLEKAFSAKKSYSFCNPFLNNASQSLILKEAANRLGLKFICLKPSLNCISDIVTGKSVLFQSGMSQYTSFLARSVSNDKFLTKNILENISINTPMGFKFAIKEKEKALEKIDFSDNKVWVLKPLSGSGGSGVSTDIRDLDAFETAWNICANQKAKTILIEEQVSGNDYRIVVVQDHICAVTQRIAAYVVGDGKQTIRDLIKLKAEERKKNPFYRLKVFEPNEIMVEFLRKKELTLDSVPARLERVELLEAVNIGSGGESIDRTDIVHPAWNDIAVKIRKAILNAYHVGLDLMAEDISKSPHEQKWSIIEVNTNPDLGLQLFPEVGSPRDIGVSLLLSIFGDLSHLKKHVYTLTILGKVQKVGFRKWFKSICEVRSISGYIRNTSEEDVVEALICGHEATLDEVIELSYKGPKNSEVKTIVFGELSSDLGEKYKTFKIK